MFHIQWGALGPPGGRNRTTSPLGEIEQDMSNFRLSFRGPLSQREQNMQTHGLSRSSFFDEDSLVTSFNDAIDNLLDNSHNLMSMLPVIPSQLQRSQRQAPRRYPRGRGRDRERSTDSFIEVMHNPRGNAVGNNSSSIDRNNHLFPAPRQDRQVWYDPNEPIPENRLPHIPKRVLTLAQIDRIPTQKATAAGGSCDICLDDFNKGDVKKILNCKHDYHVKCVDSWLKQNTTCPKCRRQVRAPPERKNRPPRPVPPPCPIRERARAYDQERRARARQEAVQDEAQSGSTLEIQTQSAEVEEVQQLPTTVNIHVQMPDRARAGLISEFPLIEQDVHSQRIRNEESSQANVSGDNTQHNEADQV